MSDPFLLLVFAVVAGGISGFAAAVFYIKIRQQYLDEQALSLRKAARRFENASKLGNTRLAVDFRQL